MATTRRGFLLTPIVAGLAQNPDLEAGFTSLFDGKSLRGWSVQEGPETAFYVDEGAIVVHPGSNFPTWLRSDRRYENFDFRGEFFLSGWMDSGVFLHAPDHGRNAWAGFEVKLFHQAQDVPDAYGNGSIFPLIAPKAVYVKNKKEWNTFRVVFDWPHLRVWMNDTLVQDLDVETNAELRYRLRSGYLGFESLSYPIRFRNLRIRELPSKEKWESLYESPSDAGLWFVSEGKPVLQPVGGVMRLEGLGHIATKKQYKDFELHTYIRTSRAHNGGVIFRSSGGGTRAQRHYEIQLHNVEGAHFPTGSLYHYKRAQYPRIVDEQWWLLQLVVRGASVLGRINGETVLQYDTLENVDAGHIELQAHQTGTWVEFKRLRIKG
ncbi:MAG: DUF1080 domain-containing protein [Candidatus Solibacter usitatus]|nr:DUF1080 domain-containing protein [Candidatus Solibacter usitatus]